MINNDDVRHPPEMTNGIADDQPHLSDADTTSCQLHSSILTNGIHQSEPLQILLKLLWVKATVTYYPMQYLI